MGVGAGVYMYVVVVKSSRSLCHLLMSSCMFIGPSPTFPENLTQICLKVFDRQTNNDDYAEVITEVN